MTIILKLGDIKSDKSVSIQRILSPQELKKPGVKSSFFKSLIGKDEKKLVRNLRN